MLGMPLCAELLSSPLDKRMNDRIDEGTTMGYSPMVCPSAHSRVHLPAIRSLRNVQERHPVVNAGVRVNVSNAPSRRPCGSSDQQLLTTVIRVRRVFTAHATRDENNVRNRSGNRHRRRATIARVPLIIVEFLTFWSGIITVLDLTFSPFCTVFPDRECGELGLIYLRVGIFLSRSVINAERENITPFCALFRIT